MFKFYKMVFLFMLFASTFMVISANSWFSAWMGLEINMLSIIPLMNNMMNSYSTESSLKYFIVQALASSIFLMSMIMLSFENFIQLLNNFMVYSLNSSLLLKMGMPPFHFWFPEMLEGLNWMNCSIILIWQKISPMIILMYNSCYNLFFLLIISLGMTISGIMGINQVSLRKIMAYSSINHMSWMLASLMFSSLIWMNYFLIYVILSFLVLIYLYKSNTFYFQQFFFIKNPFKIVFVLNFLAMGGIPPFIGFFSKWMVIQTLLQNQLFLLSFFMIFLTLISLYFYMRFITSSFLFYIEKLNFFYFKSTNSFFYWNLLIIVTFSLILSSLTYNLC
uniref:NADH-ubiquinone oxidoreductase chain 2 n=1 Tax=Stenus boops TaxID=878996 RepID=A0A191ZS27_9COLE|nr:NADH dehydrogenase subunit 2 [Stenus boops]